MVKNTGSGGGAPDSEQFATLVQQHYQTLYRAAYRLTRSAVDAEDLVQEVCARAYPRMDELARLEQPRGWLLRVLYRLFVDLRRRYERTHVRPIADDEDFTSHDLGPAEEADREREQSRVAQAWQHLSNEQRVLLALHDIEGYTVAEIQKLTSIKEGTIKSRLHRARVRLGRLLLRNEVAVAIAGDDDE